MTIEELFDYFENNKDKIFEAKFGKYWIQLPFGLLGDMLLKIIAYATLEKKNEMGEQKE